MPQLPADVPDPVDAFIDRELLGDVRTRSQIETVVSSLSRQTASPYSRIVFALIHEMLPEAMAMVLWLGILRHKAVLETRLGRGIGLQMAALDFLNEPAGPHGPALSSQWPRHQCRVQLITQTSLERLAHSALTDGLTGAMNHTHFQQVLQEELYRAQRYGRPLSLLLLDLDDFQSLNDELGHGAGDRLLMAVSEILLENMRQSDRLGRYGGEEFAVILPETDPKGAARLARKLRDQIARQAAKRVSIADQRVTASCGMATASARVRTPGELIRAASLALLQAKDRGKDRGVHFSSLRGGRTPRLLLLAANADAIRPIQKALRPDRTGQAARVRVARPLQIQAVTSPIAALDAAATRVPEIVLVDGSLPSGDVLSFCRLLRKNPLTFETPLVAIIDGDQGDRSAVLAQAGVTRVVSSRGEHRGLLRVVQSLVKKVQSP